jgi:hypothetical protein
MHCAPQGIINQHVHDGDTVETLPDGNVGVRFLGVRRMMHHHTRRCETYLSIYLSKPTSV